MTDSIRQIGGYLAYNVAYPTRLDAQRDAKEGEGITQPSGQKLISFEEVQKHNKRDDCWVIIKVSLMYAEEAILY